MTFTVVLSTREPAPSWTAWKHWKRGVLAVHHDRAELRRQHDISWMTNTWICIQFETDGRSEAVFVNDARFFYLAGYLPHRKLLRALDALVA